MGKTQATNFLMLQTYLVKTFSGVFLALIQYFFTLENIGLGVTVEDPSILE